MKHKFQHEYIFEHIYKFNNNNSIDYSTCFNSEKINLAIKKLINEYVNTNLELYNFRNSIYQQLFSQSEIGYSYLNLSTMPYNNDELLAIANFICFLIGLPIKLYNKGVFWEPLTVKLDAAKNRTHGTGENPLHIDLVNRKNTPDLIAFFGVRADPLGGGYTELANLIDAEDCLSASEIELLQMPIFKYWKDENVCHVGEHLDRYAILPKNIHEDTIRFTAKMIPHLDGTDTVIDDTAISLTKSIKSALEKYFKYLNDHKLRFLIEKNQLLIFNQKKYAHARSALGEHQETLLKDQTRLLLQGYILK